MGVHASAWKHRHINAHHYAPNVEGYDSDLNISHLIRVIPSSNYKWYHRYQHVYAPLAYTSYSLFWIFIKDFVLLYTDVDLSDNRKLKYHAGFWLQKFIYFIVILAIPIMFSHQTLVIALFGFLLMHVTQSLFLLFTFFMTHHVMSTEYPTTDKDGRIETSWVMNQVKSSNDMHPFSKTANFILGGFNNHIAHHLFPNVHHIYYPKMSVIIYRILRENRIEPNQTTYWEGIVSHMRLLKSLSLDPSA